jgi:hypothetical protein
LKNKADEEEHFHVIASSISADEITQPLPCAGRSTAGVAASDIGSSQPGVSLATFDGTVMRAQQHEGAVDSLA